MVSSEFVTASQNLSQRVGDLQKLAAEQAAAPKRPSAEPKPLVSTERSSPDGYIEVTVVDGQIESLSVDGQWFRETHPNTAWDAVRTTINQALETNSEQVLVELRKIDPGLDAAQRLVEQTAHDFTTAFQNLLNRS